MDKFKIIIFLTFLFDISFAQNKIILDKIYQENIKTVTIKPVNALLSYPIIKLNSNEKIKFCFDDLNFNNQVFDYYYTFIHCNSDWTISDLYFEDYCDGFAENQIYDYDNSFNTLKDYVNFHLEFPNDDINFLKSGNYAILIYRDGNLEDTVLTKRFCVTENSATINGNVKVPTISSFRTNKQEVNFSVKSAEFEKINPLQYVSVTVAQNNRPDIAKQGIKPRFINGNELIFDNQFENNYFAGNEFRYLDIQSIRFKSEKITDINLVDDLYSFFLFPEEEKTKYFYQKDMNGSFFINNSLGREPDNDADYAYVYFYFPREHPYINDNLYIFGEITNWDYLPEFKMKYNKYKQTYEQIVLLKQGYYNYKFKLKNNEEITQIDGNFYETKNDYVVYVYLKDIGYNYDRLIAVKILTNN